MAFHQSLISGEAIKEPSMELSLSSGSTLSLDSLRQKSDRSSTPSRSPCRPSVPQTLLSLPNTHFHNLGTSPSPTNVQRAGSRSSLDPIMGNEAF